MYEIIGGSPVDLEADYTTHRMLEVAGAGQAVISLAARSSRAGLGLGHHGATSSYLHLSKTPRLLPHTQLGLLLAPQPLAGSGCIW